MTDWGTKPCPVCGRLYATNWYGRHLVKEHGWRYWESPNTPTPIPNWWRPRDEKGHFVKDSTQGPLNTKEGME